MKQNPFVFACMTPHGSEIIEELSLSNVSLMARTRRSMERLGADMKAAKPDVLIVLTPHGTRVDGQFSIANCEHMYGVVEDNGATVTMDRAVDRALAASIADTATGMGLPVGVLNFATSEGPLSCMPLDWGAIVPLYFMTDVPIVVITPSRLIGYDNHLRLGAAIAKAAQASDKRVGLIASCDWSHAHDAAGPYGYHEAAAQLDKQVVALIESNDLEGMMGFQAQFVEDAKPDGIWQALILAGAIPRDVRKVQFLSYEVPTYFGLMCAAYAGE